MRSPILLVLAGATLLSATAAAPADPAPIADDVEDVQLVTRVAVTDSASLRGRATLTGHVDIVVSCRPYPAGTSGSCARQHRIGATHVLRAADPEPTRRTRFRATVRVVSDSTRRARLRIPVPPVRCAGVDDGFLLSFSVPLIEVGSGGEPEIFTPQAPGYGCTVTGRVSSRATALRQARATFAKRLGAPGSGRAKAVVDCQDEYHARITWRCVRRVPTGRDRSGPSRCWRLTFTRVSPNRFGRLERTAFRKVSPVSRSFRVPSASKCSG